MDENVLDMQPEGERWDPLGAPNDQDDDEQTCANKNTSFECQGCSQWYVSRIISKNMDHNIYKCCQNVICFEKIDFPNWIKVLKCLFFLVNILYQD